MTASKHDTSFNLQKGMRVRYAYSAGAITCQSNGKIINGEGTIDEIRPRGREPYIGVGSKWLFPSEIREVVP